MKNLSDEERAMIVPRNTILLGYVGSISHGTYRPSTEPDSIDDKDILGTCIADENVYYGLGRMEQKEVKFKEWDSVVYEVKKMFRLWLQGNPNVVGLLWLEPHFYIIRTEAGKRIIENRAMFSSKQVYHTFTGYAYAQLKRMENHACQGYMGDKRKRLVEKFGYDTKNASHLIRLLRMGIEFLTEGELHVLRQDAPQLVAIKRGEWQLDQIKREAEHLFALAEDAYVHSKLPDQPARARAEELLVDILREHLR